MEYVISITLGVISGLITIWIGVVIFSPKFFISNKIIHTPDIGGEYVYCLKYENQGWRTAIDIKYRVVLFVKGLRINAPQNIILFELKSSSNESYRCTELGSNVVRFAGKLKELTDNQKITYDENTIAAFESGDLKEMLKVGTDAFIRFQLIASDGRTGFRRYFYSRKLKYSDVVNVKNHGFYFDSVKTFDKTEIQLKPPVRRFPKMNTNKFNSLVLTKKIVRLFYELSYNYFEKYIHIYKGKSQT